MKQNFSQHLDRGERYDIKELLNRLDFADLLVSRYKAKLIRRSASGYMCRCLFPDHEDRTPSFSVDLFKKLYHCFGCGRGGNAIHLIMELEDRSFKEALTILNSYRR